MPRPTSHSDRFRKRLDAELRGTEQARKSVGHPVEYPATSAVAFGLLGALGYTNDRQSIDYAIRCAKQDGLRMPKVKQSLLRWTREQVIELAMQLERKRAWAPGRHDDRKTCWELDAELGAKQELADASTMLELRSLPELLDAAAGISYPETVPFRSLAARLYLRHAHAKSQRVPDGLFEALFALASNDDSRKLQGLLARVRGEVRKSPEVLS